jgi:hypothetical protein
MRTIAIVAALIVAHPGLAAPVADSHLKAMAGNLFPAVEAIAPERLPADVRHMLEARRTRITACGKDAHCAVEASLWTPAESALLAAAVEKSVKAGAFTLLDDGIRPEVERELTGLNNILKVYGLGAPARYPLIDGPTEGIPFAQSIANISYALDLAVAGRDDPSTALDPGIGLALSLLDANDRGEAGAFEPLDGQYNAAAVAKARTIDWKRYRYTAIIIPGVGPDDLGTPLSARGKLNVRMAAQHLADGVAPFVILSGSSVHPRETRFVEALEMRKALIERFGVPADSIVIDPYARHTTTNMRNATRRLVALGAPLDRDALIVTNADQSRYIEGKEFVARNQLELGYQPGTVEKRLSPFELTFRPSLSSMRVDPMDPLDP